jgi:hypothetical protein
MPCLIVLGKIKWGCYLGINLNHDRCIECGFESDDIDVTL